MRSMCGSPAMNRVLAAGLAMALAACSDSAPEAPPPGAAVNCALAGAVDFAPDCTMQRAERDDQSLLILRHPDGGFRRFRLGVPGQGLVVADGVEDAVVAETDAGIEVQVGQDRYLLPVTD